MELVLPAVPILPPSPSPKAPATLLARRSARSPHPHVPGQENHAASTMANTLTTTSTVLHESQSLPAAMNLTLNATKHHYAVASGSSSSTNILRPIPRKAFTHITRDAAAGGSNLLPFVPLTPIMASPSLTPEPGPGAREGKSVGVTVGSRSGGVQNDDYWGARDVGARPAHSQIGQSGGGHEADSILGGVSHTQEDDKVASDVSRHVHGDEVSSSSAIQDQHEAIGECTASLGLSSIPSSGPNNAPVWMSTPPTPPQMPESQLAFDALPGTQGPSAVLVPGTDSGLHGRQSSQPRQPFQTQSPLPALPSDTRPRTTTLRTMSSPSLARDSRRRQSLPPGFGKPLPALPSPASADTASESLPHFRLSSSTSSSSLTTSFGSPSRPDARKGIELDRFGTEENVFLPPSLSRSTNHHGRREAMIAAEVKTEVRYASPVDASNSMTSYKTARSSNSTPSSPTRPSSGKRMFTLEGSVSEGEEAGDMEIARGRKVERELAADAAELKRMRRFHALLELLKTEVGYLMDLRALVMIYLTQLANFTVYVPSPSLSRTSPSSRSLSNLSLTRSFPSSRSNVTITPLSVGPGPPATGPDIHSSPSRADADGWRDKGKLHPDTGRAPKKPQSNRRPLLNEAELQLVSRNAEDVLTMHEALVVDLKEAVAHMGFAGVFDRLEGGMGVCEEGEVDYWTTSDMVDDAVTAAMGVFTRQSSCFGIYEHFCPKHNEAAEVLRNGQDQYPVEWDAFEQRCSLLVAHAFELSAQRPLRKAKEDVESGEHPSTPDSVKRARRHSTPVQSSPLLSSDPIPPGLLDAHRRKRSGEDLQLTSQIGRLKFADYLIKPVQRICKYPLLLDQLKSNAADNSADGVERACAAMRSVVSLVDNASMRQAHTVKSALIVSRMSPWLPIAPPRSSSPSHPASSPVEERPSLTVEFLTSLGACLLGGALDIVQHPSSRARYLGTFLYVGGYMVMVKVTKGGKVYEPKYWFSLAGFELVDSEVDDAAFPYSFYLCGHGHFLQLAAACQVEKEIWMAAIQDATSMPPEWKNEPVSSLPEAILPAAEEHHEFTTTPLPTIQSLSELEGSDTASPPMTAKPQSRPYKTMPRMDGSALRHESQNSNLSRRSSTASVKAFFAPLSFDISSRVSRPSSQVRQQVDHALHDVFSDNCLTVRSQALMREEELFQIRKKTPAGMSRSNSGLSLTSAMRRRYDSVLVSSRRRSSMDGQGADPSSDTENGRTISRRALTLGARRRQHPRLSLVSSEGSILAEADPPSLSPDIMPDSPSPLSNCSSATSSHAGSAMPSPMQGTIQLSLPLESRGKSEPTSMPIRDYLPKRTRSMVDNFRYFFHSRSASPTPSSSGFPSPRTVTHTLDPDVNSLVHWWRRGSLRRRSQSSPDVPNDESACTTPGLSSDDQHILTDDKHSPHMRRRDSAMSHDTDIPRSAPSPRRVAFKESLPFRRRSLYATTRHDHQPHGPVRSDSAPSTPRRSLRTVLFFRSNSFTPLDTSHQ